MRGGAGLVFVLGGPGSGKGTQCARLASAFAGSAVGHVSAGELLRTAAAERRLSPEDSASVLQGRIVDGRITARLLRREIVEKEGTQRLWLVDGFPRNWDNVAAFQEVFGEKEAGMLLKKVLALNAGEDTLRRRLLGRGRVDDQEEVIARRIRSFRECTAKVLEKYDADGLLENIDADMEEDLVFRQCYKAIYPLICGDFL